MIPSDPIFHKPKAIVAAKNIIYATMFLSAICWVFIKWNAEGVIITILNLLIQYILARQIGLGRKWARTAYLALFILGLLGLWFMMPVFRSNILLATLYLIQAILQILALNFLFSQKSTHWFGSVRSFVPEPGKES